MPPYLYELIPPFQRSPCYPSYFKILFCKTELFRNSFLPFTINEWNKLDCDIKDSDSYAILRRKLLAFIRPAGNSMYGIYEPFGVRLINRLRMGFSHLWQHKFTHSLSILWTRYAHALLKLKIQSISFYAAKTTYLLAQRLWSSE